MKIEGPRGKAPEFGLKILLKQIQRKGKFLLPTSQPRHTMENSDRTTDKKINFQIKKSSWTRIYPNQATTGDNTKL
jgi:hypothetical protein